MNPKNNFKLSKTILSSIILLICFISNAYCQTFETICAPNIINDSNNSELIYISIVKCENGPLPESFEIKIGFDNDVFKKNSKIDYCEEIHKNYNHNKSMVGNDISIKCSLKPSRSAPEIAKGEELFSVTMETKKSISKSETNFKITIESDSEKEIQNVPVKIEKSECEKTYPVLTKLIPSQGELIPEFNPNIINYNLNVPYDTKDIEFDVEDENSSGININRHKLNAPGSETDVFITVKGEKKGDKNIYHIVVHRDDTPNCENTKSKSHTNKTDPRNILKGIMPRKKSYKNRKVKTKKGNKYDLDEGDDSEGSEENPNMKTFKEIEMKQKENNDRSKEKLYSIIVLSSILCLYATYMVIKKKKLLKNKKELNKTSKK